MTGFAQVFGGNNIYPVQPTYSQLNYAANIELAWPIEQAIAGALVLTDIVDLNPSAAGLTVSLPDARQVSTGYTALFNNISGQNTSVLSATDQTLVSPVPGTIWQLYLIDNSTVGGTWRIFQFGASVSVAVAAALVGAGLTAIGSTLNVQMMINPQSGNYTVLPTDRGSVLQWTGGVGTFTLPTAGSVGSGWFVVVKNQGTGNLTVTPPAAGGTIDGNPTDTVPPGATVWYLSDGTNYYTLKGGQTVGAGGFNLLVIDVSGSGNYILAGAQLNQIGYRLTGLLTGNRTIIVPNTTQEYWVDNSTTGAYSLYVGTAAQVSPLLLPQGSRYIMYCDGSNVVNALTNFIAFPLTVQQGGTGATTANQALINLGGVAAGTQTYAALADVTLSTLANGQMPYWNSTASRWENNPNMTIIPDNSQIAGGVSGGMGNSISFESDGHTWIYNGLTTYPTGGIGASTSNPSCNVHGNWNAIAGWIGLVLDDGSVTPNTETVIGGIGGGALVAGALKNDIQIQSLSGWIYVGGAGGQSFILEGYNTSGANAGLIQMNGNNNFRVKNMTALGSGAQGGGGELVLGGQGIDLIEITGTHISCIGPSTGTPGTAIDMTPDHGEFVATSSGVASPSFTTGWNWVKMGEVVIIYCVNGASFTSLGGSLLLSGMPVSIRPPVRRSLIGAGVTAVAGAAGLVTAGWAQINTDGTFYLWPLYTANANNPTMLNMTAENWNPGASAINVGLTFVYGLY